ncbi:uncharacterized protein SPPG_02519 [Spizellomyces punctatus DAOM BR117]|uniref:C2H2-type domain-containing protein n=1 Tax=Spizellomyces punctatus (strain DAOM BR117) TaxID=645134 RepID=A0A0L0HM76_SPIPD|nr:uncharacterized protein SPPG_02519 [Spizellomyces punctatus DAOM BR117]KND02015.1 hypothetical protein SPPG_02519 [Spizellomyces punctatus DAOM BR117]|eukprot:XP_016610054.1 hypothetical protein SPPG_02519 [Spizellomyces punctatus DAOM BR117]
MAAWPCLPNNIPDCAKCKLLREHIEALKEDVTEERRLFEDFQETSREYEQELQTENTQLHKQLESLQTRLEATRTDADVWKQRWRIAKQDAVNELNIVIGELERTRTQEECYKRRTVDLEMDNDCLERAERVVKSSIQDLDARYTALLEENVLLKCELETANGYRDEIIHLQEEIRDLQMELGVLRDRDRALATTHFWQNASRNASQVSIAASPTALMLRAYGVTMSRRNSSDLSTTTLANAPPLPNGGKIGDLDANRCESVDCGERLARVETIGPHDEIKHSTKGLKRILRKVGPPLAALPSKGRKQTLKVKRYFSVKYKELCNIRSAA